MENFDLDKDLAELWQTSEEQGKKVLNAIDLEKSLQRQSSNIKNKILRNLIIEIVLGVIVTVYGGIVIYPQSALFYLFTISSSLLLLLSIIISVYINNRFNSLNALEIRESIVQKITLLQLFLKATRRLYYVLMPFGFYLGLTIGFFLALETPIDFSMPTLWVVYLLMLPLLLLTMWFFEKKYLYWFYGRYKKEYEEILMRLDQGE